MEVGEAKGRPPPDWYLEEPQLSELGQFLVTVFWDLSTCRQIGFVEGPIPWTAMVFWADRHGLEDDAADIFTLVLREMDAAYIKWHQDNRPRK